MVEQRIRSYTLLARAEALTGAAAAVIIFGLYGFKPSLLADPNLSLTAAIMGMVAVVYFATIHQILSRTRPETSTLILSGIVAATIMLVIGETGGLDSPYYGLWLLILVAAGIFGTGPIIIILGGTLTLYLISFIAEGFHGRYLKDHLIQLIITIVAAGLAEWIHTRSRQVTVQSSKLASLSGQLSEEQLKAQVLMSSIGEGVLVINNQGQIQLFNKAAQTVTGWDESSARNIDYKLVMNLKTAADAELDETTDPFIEASKRRELIVRNDLIMTTRAGHKIPLSISVSPIYDNAGTATGAIALFRDITKEKELERQKDEFVSTASHEMRTPVAAIEGYISLAMNSNVATIDDRAMKYLTKAHETIGHLGELFRDLLSVTKAEEGNLTAKIEAVDINKLLEGAVGDMQFAASHKKLNLIYQVSSQNGKAISPIYYVGANPERLREVVMNLIDNAIKFTAEGGITVSLDGNDKEIKVGVHDTGIGIAKEDGEHLFQKFYRIDSSATRTIGGTGLGLYLCRTVIELFQGRLWVESEPGKGSNFYFTLPRLAADRAKAMLAAADQAAPETAAAQSTPQPGAVPTAQPAPTAQPIPTPAPAPAAQPVSVAIGPPPV